MSKRRQASYQGYENLGRQKILHEIYEILKDKYPEVAKLLMDRFGKE